MNVPPPPCGKKKGKPRSPPLDPRNNVIALSRYQGNPFLTRPPTAVLALHPFPISGGGSSQSQGVLEPPAGRNPEPIGQACRVPSAAGRSADPQSLAAIEPALVGEINPKGPGAIRPNGHRWPVLGERLQPAVVGGGAPQAANPARPTSRCAGQRGGATARVWACVRHTIAWPRRGVVAVGMGGGRGWGYFVHGNSGARVLAV